MDSPNPVGRPRADAADIRLQPPVEVTRKDMRESGLDVLSAAETKTAHDQWLARWYHGDGWSNVLTGHGTSAYDKSYYTRFCTDVITEDEGRDLWRGDDLAARAVEAIVDEATVKPFKACIPDDAEGNDEQYGKELVDKIESKWTELEALDVLHEAACIERACGGAAIMLGADDGALSLEEPLNLERVKSFNWLTVFEPREVCPVQWYTDARAPKFGKPEIYMLTPIITGTPKPGAQLQTPMVRVHESRLIIFKGVRVSRTNQYGQSTGWGDNIFTRAYRTLRGFNAAYGGAEILVHEFGLPVFKIKGLADIIAKDNKQLFTARMQALALSMSTARAALIDSEESYERQTMTVTGLSDLLLQFCKRLAAAFNTPVSVLFGEAPGGINASGAQNDQISIWNKRVEAYRCKKLIPALRLITQLILITMGGEPDKWWIEGEPLQTPTAKEEADTEKVETDTIVELWDRGLLSTDEIRRNPDFAKRWRISVSDAPAIDPNSPEAAALRTPGGAPVDPNAPPVDPNAPTDPNAKPAAPGSAGGATSGNIQHEALNGAQVTSLVEVIKAVAAGEIPANSAQRILELAFQLSPSDAAAMMPPPGFKSASATAAEASANNPPPAGDFTFGKNPVPPAADKQA
jgi:phage-related protein (TIGR01555 family)